jgi:hypothetical protein
MQPVFIFFLTEFLPLMLVATTVYVVFSVIMCSAATVFPAIESCFGTKVSKAVPMFCIVAILATLRWCKD